MDIAVIGTGFIGGILGRALSRSGHTVTFGSRHPNDDDVVDHTEATVESIPDALSMSDVVILAVPGAAVSELTAQHGTALEGKLVIDAANQAGRPVANCRAKLPSKVRHARTFNTLGAEVMENPVFLGGTADMFFSAPETDRATIDQVVSGVGLRPVYVGDGREELIDASFRIWIALAVTQHRGRRIAPPVLED
jgi:8-hydroxy-5-deazaflavin:NADPH oxidoreductase